MEMITLGEIYSQGFVHRTYDPDTIVHHRLNEIEFKTSEEGDSSYGINDLHYFIKDWYLSLWKSVGLNIHNVTFRTRELKKGEFVELHSPMMESQYKAIIMCPRYDYEGAEFVFSGPDGVLHYEKLGFGDIMFCRTGSSEYVQGFRSLESNESIRYIEIYGALNFKKPIEDEVYEDMKINDIKLI